jgi:predicted RNA-binding Zn-ribbon protein involved in translation (DUF1610 family)
MYYNMSNNPNNKDHIIINISGKINNDMNKDNKSKHDDECGNAKNDDECKKFNSDDKYDKYDKYGKFDDDELESTTKKEYDEIIKDLDKVIDNYLDAKNIMHMTGHPKDSIGSIERNSIILNNPLYMRPRRRAIGIPKLNIFDLKSMDKPSGEINNMTSLFDDYGFKTMHSNKKVIQSTTTASTSTSTSTSTFASDIRIDTSVGANIDIYMDMDIDMDIDMDMDDNKEVKNKDKDNASKNITSEDINRLLITASDFTEELKVNDISDSKEELPISDISDFMCPQCGIFAKNDVELNDHILVQHDNAFAFQEEEYTCDNCGTKFYNEDEFYSHTDNQKCKVRKILKKIVVSPLPPADIIPEANNDINDDINNDIMPEGDDLPDIESVSSVTSFENEKSMGWAKDVESHMTPKSMKTGVKIDVKSSAYASSLKAYRLFGAGGYMEQRKKIIKRNEYDDSSSESDGSDNNEESVVKPFDSDEIPTVDNIPTSIYGRFACPNCSKKYLTQNHLGEHFIISHSNYSDQLSLDDKNIIHGFPGFEVLEAINMIEQFRDHVEMNIIINTQKHCLICVCEYKQSETIDEIDHKVEENNCYASDSELLDRMNNKLSRSGSLNNISRLNKLLSKKNKRSIRDNTLIEHMNKKKISSKLPIKMTCCDNYLCHGCLEKSLLTSNNLQCMFCKHDHTQYGEEYIKIYEIKNKLNKNAWKKWWKNHMEIFI